MPSADAVAWAIVAACRETGDDPIAIASREVGGRARHYAMHALLHVFQELGRHAAASLVGCPGKPNGFYMNSWHRVARVVSPTGRRQANWWDEDAYGRVIAAVEAAVPRAPIKLSAATGSIVEPLRPAASAGKRALQEMLAEAVRNTAAMTPHQE